MLKSEDLKRIVMLSGLSEKRKEEIIGKIEELEAKREKEKEDPGDEEEEEK